MFAAHRHQTGVRFCFLHSGRLQPFPERKWLGTECLFFSSKQIERHTQAPLSLGASPPLPRTCSRKQRKVRHKRLCRASILGLRLAGGWAAASPPSTGDAVLIPAVLRGKGERKIKKKEEPVYSLLLASDEQGGTGLPSLEPARGDQLLHAHCREGTSLGCAGPTTPRKVGK